ncbi:MAG: hypothetical protein QXD03_04760 [Candidatus Anstonellales archaeon]
MRIGGRWIRIDKSTLMVNSGDYLSVSIDNNTIVSISDQLAIGPRSITRDHLLLDTISPGINASVIPIVNSGGNFPGSEYIEDALNTIAEKHFLVRYTALSFYGIRAVDSNGSVSKDITSLIVSAIPNHNNGQGSSTREGVVTSSTRKYNIPLRDHDTKSPVRTPSGNEIVAYLRYDENLGRYYLDYYDEGTSSAYDGFTTHDFIDFAYVLYSAKFLNIPWNNIFIDESWQNINDVSSTIDDNIIVDGMQYLLNGLTTQAQVNLKLDTLGSPSYGSKLISYNPDGSNYYGTSDLNLSEVINRISSVLGGLSWDNRNYTESNYVLSTDSLTTSIDRLDSFIHDFTTTNENEGASLIGIHDANNVFTSTNVEDALYELYNKAVSGKTISQYVSLSSSDINNGYIQLNGIVSGNIVNNNIVIPSCMSVDCLQGSSADVSEFIIIRNSSGTVDFFVFKNGVTPPGCDPTIYSINTLEFGNLLEAGFVLRLVYATLTT